MEMTKKTNPSECGLMPYSIIIAAINGDIDSIHLIAKHYESYITFLSMRKFIDIYGNIYYGIDGDIRERLMSKLIKSIFLFDM